MTNDITLHDSLQIIYQAYDRIYAIASHRWCASDYYNNLTHTSDLFGHYVRTLPRFSDTDPAYITCSQYNEYAEPLVSAFNQVLHLILLDNLKSSDIRRICNGSAALFYHDTPYDRCMAAFRLVEKQYPRATYHDDARLRKKKKAKTRREPRPRSHATYHKPQRTVRWMPYKD